MSEPLILTIPPALADALREAVEAGEYASVDHGLADALEVWAERHERQADDLAWMKARIKASIDDPRPSLSMAEVDEHLEAFFRNVERRSDEAA